MTSFSGYDSSTYNLRISALRSSHDLEGMDVGVAIVSFGWKTEVRRFGIEAREQAVSPERFYGQWDPAEWFVYDFHMGTATMGPGNGEPLRAAAVHPLENASSLIPTLPKLSVSAGDESTMPPPCICKSAVFYKSRRRYWS